MKIIVDAMPEKPEKCKFHGDLVNGFYECKITGKKCPYDEGGTCRVLKTFSECIAPYIR